jgi:hypothetical protein
VLERATAVSSSKWEQWIKNPAALGTGNPNLFDQFHGRSPTRTLNAAIYITVVIIMGESESRSIYSRMVTAIEFSGTMAPSLGLSNTS